MIRALSWPAGRRALRALAWGLLALGIAVLACLAGLRWAGGIERWEHWLRIHAPYFLLWRLCLYTATAYGWCWLRRRLLRRESDAGFRRRLCALELLAVAGLALTEFGMPA